jgi:hypothetical protein
MRPRDKGDLRPIPPNSLPNFGGGEARRPRPLVECKWSDAEPDRNLRYLKGRIPDAEAWQISVTGGKDYRTQDGLRIAPAIELLRTLV